MENDILALREADCSIVWLRRSSDSQIANLVLLTLTSMMFLRSSLKVVAWSITLPHRPDFLDKDHLFFPISGHLYCQCFTRSVWVDPDFPLHSNPDYHDWPIRGRFPTISFWLLSEISNLSSQTSSEDPCFVLYQVLSWLCSAFFLWKYLERVKVGLELEMSTLLYYLLGLSVSYPYLELHAIYSLACPLDCLVQ